MFRGSGIFILNISQKLKAVQLMSTSKSEDNEIANNILLNLFYDESNLDLIVASVKIYKRQSFGYLSRDLVNIDFWTPVHL
jgi:hypothetical protein